MTGERERPETKRIRWDMAGDRVLVLMYMAVPLYGIAVLKQDPTFLTPLLGLTGFGYVAGIVWVLRLIRTYDPPVSGERALAIQLAGLAPWLILWAGSDRYAPLTRMNFVFPLLLVWSYVAHWLARARAPERHRRAIHAFFWTSAAQVLAAAALIFQDDQPHLSPASFAPAAVALCVAAYCLIVNRPARQEPPLA